MPLTNQYNLPDALIDAIKNDPYTKGKGKYSITELLNPPQVAILKQRYKDKITTDVSDEIWRLFGKSFHAYIGSYQKSDVLTEEIYYKEIEGVLIKAQADAVYTNALLDDYKVTSVYTVRNGSRMNDWEWQTNGYAWILEENGYEVKELRIIAIMRDWHEGNKVKQRNYPVCQIQPIYIKRKSNEEIAEYFTERVKLFEKNYERPDSLLKECTEAERWIDNARCRKYCEGSSFCKQWEMMKFIAEKEKQADKTISAQGD